MASLQISIGIDNRNDIQPKKATRKEIERIVMQKYSPDIAFFNWGRGALTLSFSAKADPIATAFDIGKGLQKEIDKVQ